MSPDKSEDEVRRLDASALKAYTHPLRLQMIRYLNDHGPATATQLASRLGESTGQTSYHLRQLARHGLVEDDPTRGTGRERWWRSTSFQVDATRLREDPELAPAALAMLGGMVQGRTEALGRWVAQSVDAPQEWVDVTLHSQSTLTLTPTELERLNAAHQELLEPFTALSRRRETEGSPPDAVRVRVYYDAFPLLGEG